jgi:uncharacterized protein YutE (UPF0331/DUF86 family)
VDRDVIANKLESLRRCLVRVSEKCPDSAEKLATDPDAQDILTLNLTRSIQLCVDIAVHLIASTDSPPPTTMGASFDALAATGFIDNELALKLKKAVGFRNIAIHNYEAVDWQIVFAIATQHLDDFTDFARHTIETLKL